VPAHRLAPTPAPAAAASISWERLHQDDEERTFLQKITPMHMGLMLVGVVLLMIITSKPGAIRATGEALPGIAEGGGGVMMPVQPRTSVTPTGTTLAPVKTIKIGSGELPVTAQHGGIPSIAASNAMAHGVTGGGGPAVDDGVTLPRSTGERDTATDTPKSVDGGGGVAEELPSAPVATPGQAAMAAERQAAELYAQRPNNITLAADLGEVS
jgi:hypothetical protein